LSTNPGGSAASSTNARDPIVDFKRGIKRDTSQFPILKDEKQWDNWSRTHNAQARAQGVEEIMNTTYIPITAEDKASLTVKQTCMFAVLTDQGKAYVREYEKESDAQCSPFTDASANMLSSRRKPHSKPP
jgi:hypothetical protein